MNRHFNISFSSIVLSIVIVINSAFFVSCKKKENRNLILWTDRVELISYAELYNSLNEHQKIIVVYKENPSIDLPPAKDEEMPDVIVASWLQKKMAGKHFKDLSRIFASGSLSEEKFYPSLFDAGKKDGKQYLIPVSFNLPALIFSVDNYEYMHENHLLSFPQIKEISHEFNRQNKDKSYSAMGFGPTWNKDFLYFILKSNGLDYEVKENKFYYDRLKLTNIQDFIKDWTDTINGSVHSEQDFKFRYLYTPYYKQITSGRCLFSYSTSNQILSLPQETLDSLDFRWICNNDKIIAEDDMTMMGIYSESRNHGAAQDFIIWFMSEESQKAMLERKMAMNLDTATFGIAGGFSSIESVNERVFPVYYGALLSNIPVADYIQAPPVYPEKWKKIKENVVIPYINDISTNANNQKPLDIRFSEWLRQNM